MPCRLLIDTLLFDLHGTTIDCGSRAPVAAVREVLGRRGVEIDEPTLRRPLGTPLREHLRRLADDPALRAAWYTAHGRMPGEREVDAMAAEAEPILLAQLAGLAEPIPGFGNLLRRLREGGARVGATTPYSPATVQVLRPFLAARAWSPEVWVSAAEVPAGAPAPYLNQLAAMKLGNRNVARVVCVGDGAVDMEAARNAGMWAVGVSLTGAEAGPSWAELAEMEAGERARLAAAARERLEAAGAHVVVETVLDLPVALGVIQRPSLAALRRWQRPR